jgi:hypothetical protein
MIQQVREIKGVAGVHVMAYRQEEAVAEIIERAGLLPRGPRVEHGHVAHSHPNIGHAHHLAPHTQSNTGH